MDALVDITPIHSSNKIREVATPNPPTQSHLRIVTVQAQLFQGCTHFHQHCERWPGQLEKKRKALYQVGPY